MSTRAREQARIRRQLEAVRRRQLARQRRARRLVIAIPAAVVAIAVAAGVAMWASAPRPAAVHRGVLAGLSKMAAGAPVDGITCSTSEQSAYHIHVHLAVLVNGQQMTIPAGIGIPAAGSGNAGGCLYWLHTHDASGVVHIESPAVATYRLGDLFDIWGQPLSGSRAGPVRGHLTAYVDGRVFTGDPRSIPLRPHAVIQLDVGSKSPPRPYTFAQGL